MHRLALEGVTKHYAAGGETIRAVDGVTLGVAPGEIVAVMGPSGAGKSTLLLLAAALLRPDAGTVIFNGREISTLSGNEAADYQRRDVGFIFQHHGLLPGVPVVENAAVKLIADGMSLRRARRAAEPWLERVGLGGRLKHTPEQLSGGEAQRVALVRALVNRPGLVLADEPTGSLDSKRGHEILELLASLAREHGTSIVLVTHDPQATAVADRAFRLHDGRLVDAGPANDTGAPAPNAPQ